MPKGLEQDCYYRYFFGAYAVDLAVAGTAVDGKPKDQDQVNFNSALPARAIVMIPDGPKGDDFDADFTDKAYVYVLHSVDVFSSSMPATLRCSPRLYKPKMMARTLTSLEQLPLDSLPLLNTYESGRLVHSVTLPRYRNESRSRTYCYG